MKLSLARSSGSYSSLGDVLPKLRSRYFRGVVLAWSLASGLITGDVLGLEPLLSVRSQKTSVEVSAGMSVDERFSKLPLAFEAIETGASNTLFFARGKGFGISLEPARWSLDLRATDSGAVGRGDKEVRGRRRGGNREVVKSRRLSAQFVGASNQVAGRGSRLLSAKLNRLGGSDPTRWRSGMPLYGAVTFPEVYSGVDVVYYGNGTELEYDFVVAAGKDPGIIRVRYSGADRIRLDSDGDLLFECGAGLLRHHRPIAYQMIDGRRVEVSASYRLEGEREIVFNLGDYRKDLALVIDPVLSYSSYLGGTDADRAWAVATDGSGNAIVAGETQSATITGRQGQAFSGFVGGDALGGDAFVAKINADGSGLAWFTYIGGSGADRAFSVALDSLGNVFLAGSTASPNFPVTNAFQTTIGGAAEKRSGIYQPDGFVVKLSASGSQLLYSTYLGGEDDDEVLGLSVDSQGAAHVTGQTASTAFPTRGSSMARSTGDEVFVSKLSEDGRALVYSVTIGGDAVDSGEGIAVDSLGRAVVTGLTSSTNFPAVNAIQSTNAGAFDAFVLRLNRAGDALEYSTYFGGSSSDYGVRVSVDSLSRPVVVGQTFSTDLLLTNATQTAFGGGSDGFVARFGATGTGLEFATYIGGQGIDQAWDVALDARDNIFVSGMTSSADFPILDAFQTNLFGFEDAFVASYASDSLKLNFSTYFGGNDNDEGLGLAVESGGTAYLVGRTFSISDVALSTNSFQTNHAGGASDAFVARLTPVPKLKVQSDGVSVEITWPATHPAYGLEVRTTVAGQQSVWTAWTGPVSIVRGHNTVILPSAVGPRFYRLVRRP